MIRAAAQDNRRKGIAHSIHEHGDRLATGDFKGAREAYANRLRAVAREIGRTYEATRKRAQRIGAYSYNGDRQ